VGGTVSEIPDSGQAVSLANRIATARALEVFLNGLGEQETI
jgi:hypothetical protein|tara:strand:- start:2828 stop:2950 length:123 start_codon:yes stop_codon:yes gene_type:complete